MQVRPVSEPRIYDCVMLNDELDVLEMRLNELREKVWAHVIVEAPVTHRGDPKPLYYAGDARRFRPFSERIVHIVAEGLGGAMEPWPREHAQRDQARKAFAWTAHPDDLILIADVDELPSDAALAWRGETAAALRQRIFHSAVDWEYPQPQLTSVIARWRHVARRTLGEVRDSRNVLPVVENAGWHFAWIGDQRRREEKLARATCHLEMGAGEWEAIRSGATYERGEHYAADSRVRAVDVDETWPAWIRERKCPADWYRPQEREAE